MLSNILLQSRTYSQRETSRECTYSKPLEYIRIQGFANNEIRFTVRSKTLGPSKIYLNEETQLLHQQSLHQRKFFQEKNPKKFERYSSLYRFETSRRHNQYTDNLPQRRKNKCDRFRAFLIWLAEIEGKDGYHRCPVPDIFQYLPVNRRYNGQKVKSENLTFISYPDGTLEGWDIETEKQIVDLNINEARERIQKLLVITGELQVTPKNRAEIGQDNRKTAFTRGARHTLLEAGQVIQNLCPSTDLSTHAANARAITLTLPGSTPESYRALAAYSSWILNCLLQVVRDCKKPIHHFGVWELQKRGALHAHICIGADPSLVPMEFLEELGNRIVNRWFELLKVMASQREIKRGDKVGRLPGIDMFARSEIAVRDRPGPDTWRDHPEKWKADNLPIRKNVAAYFSKYASKNVDSGNKFKALNAYCPSRWWFCSGSVRSEIKNWRFDYTVPYDLIGSNQLIQECLGIWKPKAGYSYNFKIKAEYQGVRGWLSQGNIVNGVTKIYYWDNSIFREVWEAFRDLKPVLSEIGSFRERRDIQASEFTYHKFYSIYFNGKPSSLLLEPEFSLVKRVEFKNLPLANCLAF